jgi:hypothetical protein
MSSTLMPARSTDVPQRVEVVRRLMKRLMAFYGSKFADAYGSVPMQTLEEVWAEELAGFTMPELLRGIDACRTRPWPPTLPEFMGLCRPPVVPEVAFVEAALNLRKREAGQDPTWSHAAIFWAAVEVGSYDMQHQPYKAMSARWQQALSAQLALSSWPPIPQAPAALLEAPKGGPCPPEVAERLKGLLSRITGRRATA